MKSLIKILVIAVVLVTVSCKKDTAPNYQFMPNMYESAGYETYGEAAFPNGIQAQLPAEGTIPRGFVPFDIENSTALVKREKILGIPSYDDAGRAINAGSIYHTIYYGKNAMGSYANQLNEEERWQVVSYVLKLKADLEK